MSNIIPMVSSSPPPMDEGGGFEWDDDDDDFGTFTSANDNSFAQSDTTAKVDTSIPDHFDSEPHTNDSDDFADFAAFPSNDQSDPANIHCSKTQSNDHRPETINISHKPSDNEVLNDTNNDKNDYHNVNGQLIDSGVYSSNVSPVQCDENSGVNQLQNNIDDSGTSKCEPHDELSCGLSEESENTSVENENSDNKSDTGRTVPCDDDVLDTQENTCVVNDSETNCVSELQEDSVKCIPPKDIPENDHVHVSGNFNTNVETKDEEEKANDSASVVIPNCDSDTVNTLSSDNTHSVSNFANQESGHDKTESQTDLNEDIPELEIDTEKEAKEINSSDFRSFSNETVKHLETEQESECSQTSNTDSDALEDQQRTGETPELSEEKVSDISEDDNEHKDISNDELSSVNDKCENGDEGSVCENVTLKDDVDNTRKEHTDISCESSDNKTDVTDQEESNNEIVFENESKSVQDLKLVKDNIEEDVESSEKNSQDEPVSDNNNSNSKQEPSDFNAILEQDKDTPISEDTDDDFGDFNAPNDTPVKELGGLNTNSEKKGNDEAESDDFGEFNASFETKTNIDNLEQKEDEDFGDSNASFDSKPFSSTSEMAENNDEFGDFNATFPEKSDNNEPPEDDFGDFNAKFDSASNVNEQSNDWAAFSEPQTITQAEADDDDDDDDWAGFEEGESNTPSVSETVPAQNKMEDTSKIAKMTKHEKLLYAVTTCFPGLITDIEEYDMNLGELHDLHIDSSSQVWGQVKGQKTTEALSYQWTKSLWNSQLFTTLHIDTKNILIGHKKAPVPVYAAGLTLLEPTKGQTPLKPDVLVDTSNSSLNSATSHTQDTIPAAQFDWSSSGLTNPLEANNKTLNLDFLIQDKATKSNALESEFLSTNDSPVHKPAIQPLETILANLKTSSTFKPTNQNEDVSKEASKVLLSLPDLLFMKSKVLMFPVKLDGVEN